MEQKEVAEDGEALLAREDVATLVAIATKISSESGRTELQMKCPYCSLNITTEIGETANSKAQSRVNCRIKCVTIFMIFSCVTPFGIGLMLHDKYLEFGIAIGGTLTVILCLGFCSLLCNRGCFPDIHHTCPQCHELLGINDGWNAYKKSGTQR